MHGIYKFIGILSFFFLFQEYDSEGNEITDWDRYAAEEYEILVAEESHDAGPVSDGSGVSGSGGEGGSGVSSAFDEDFHHDSGSDAGSTDMQQVRPQLQIYDYYLWFF